MLNTFVSRVLSQLLRYDWFLKNWAWRIRRGPLKDLEWAVPMGNGYYCPLVGGIDALVAFRETFESTEYAGLFEYVQPKRWLDIGCHRGFFSLWLAKAYSRHTGKHDSAACLVDADPRSREWVQALLRYNTHLGFRYIQGAVAPGHVEAITFVVRAGMVSSADADFVRGPAQAVRVQRLSADAVMRSLPPPYDLVKVDIEGSEYTLIEHYATLLEKTRYLLIEWHASGPKLCTTDACKALEHMGFRLVRSLREAATLEVSGSKVTTSVELFERG